MKRLTHIYRQRIAGAMWVCGVLFVVLVVFGLVETSKLASNMTLTYAKNTAPIKELDAMRVAVLEIRMQVWHALAMRNADATSQSIRSIDASMDRLARSWLRYYPAGVSSVDEQHLADELIRDLPQYKQDVVKAVALLDKGDYDAAGAWLHDSAGRANGIDRALDEDIAVNTRQAEHAARESVSIVHLTFVVGSIFVGSVLLLVGGGSLYLLRARNDAKQETRYHLWLANRVFEHALNSVVVVDRNGVIERVNPGFEALTGYTQEDVLGRSPWLLNSGRQSRTFYEALWKTLNETGHWKGEVWNRSKDGRVYLESVSMSGIRNRDGSYSHFVAIGSDMTQRQLNEERLSYLATHDALTGLLNRSQFGEHLQQAVTRARRKSTRVAVLFVDLDSFKSINDTLGHGAGDEVIKTVGARIRHSLRECDVVARFGGDEFTVILEDIVDPQNVAHIAHSLVASIGAPMDIGGQRAQVTASIGIGLFPDHGTAVKDLLTHADMAMYGAKESGKNRFRFHASAGLAHSSTPHAMDPEAHLMD